MESSSSRTFSDRRSAGAALAAAVSKAHLNAPVLVLGLPRGGVPVAFEVAREIGAPLDVLVVRKIGMPGQRELAIGAIASGGIVVREPALAAHVDALGIRFDDLARAEHEELERRERAYRPGATPLVLAGKTIVLVDDGLATGSTMLAAARAARKAGATRVVVAAPVASTEASALLGREADELIILKTPPYLTSIGEWYDDFRQVEDDEVRDLLDTAAHAKPPAE